LWEDLPWVLLYADDLISIAKELPAFEKIMQWNIEQNMIINFRKMTVMFGCTNADDVRRGGSRDPTSTTKAT